MKHSEHERLFKLEGKVAWLEVQIEKLEFSGAQEGKPQWRCDACAQTRWKATSADWRIEERNGTTQFLCQYHFDWELKRVGGIDILRADRLNQGEKQDEVIEGTVDYVCVWVPKRHKWDAVPQKEKLGPILHFAYKATLVEFMKDNNFTYEYYND